MKTVAILIPNITKRAGTERAVSNLSNILCSLGYKVHLLSIASKNGDCPFKLDTDIEIIHMDLPYLKSTYFYVFKHYTFIYRKLKRICLEKKIDLVIGTYDIINFVITFLSKNITTIGCEHFNYEKSGRLKNFLKKIFYKKLDSVVLLTERDRKKYSFLRNTCVIPNSLSFVPSEISELNEKRIISLGRFTFQKGYDILIDSINIIKDYVKDWIVELYGDGEDKFMLQKKIDDYGLNDIIKLKQPTTDVESVFYSSSIFLSSSRFEGLPMVLIESQSCGVPAVVFDCPCGPSEIVVDNKTGFVVDLYDKELYAKRILELINDESLRKEYGKNAYLESKRFSTENVKNKWNILINELIKE